MDLAQPIEQALRVAFPDAVVRAEVDSVGKVSSLIVWPGFAHQTDRTRQQNVWGRLLQQFKPEELRRVNLILTSTPEEEELIRDYPPEQD